MNDGCVKVGFSSPADAKAAHSALESECGGHDRASVSVKLEGKTVCVCVRAKDVVALRASLNTCLRLLTVAKSGLEEGVVDV